MDVGDLQTAEIRIPLLSDPIPKELWRTVEEHNCKGEGQNWVYRFFENCANGFMEVCCQK
jgi:hypothetical protein